MNKERSFVGSQCKDCKRDLRHLGMRDVYRWTPMSLILQKKNYNVLQYTSEPTLGSHKLTLHYIRDWEYICSWIAFELLLFLIFLTCLWYEVSKFYNSVTIHSAISIPQTMIMQFSSVQCKQSGSTLMIPLSIEQLVHTKRTFIFSCVNQYPFSHRKIKFWQIIILQENHCIFKETAIPNWKFL